MRLVVRHQTVLDYAPPASAVAIKLRLFPASFETQRVLEWRVSVDGTEIRPGSRNGYGEAVAQWMHAGERETLTVVAEGIVDAFDAAGVVKGLAGSCPAAVYLRETDLTTLSPEIERLTEGLAGQDRLPALHELSRRTGAAFTYRGGETGAATTAAEALAGGVGVCQDYAHVFIAAARSLGVPARYVVGYLLAGDDAEQQFETHAWAEAEVPGLGWVAFDVTNGICVTDHYIRLCAGLDAADAAPMRGIVTGGQNSAVHADVRIAEAAAEREQVQQQQQ